MWDNVRVLRLLRIPAFLGAVALTAPIGDALMGAGRAEPQAAHLAPAAQAGSSAAPHTLPSEPACTIEGPCSSLEDGGARRPTSSAPVEIPRWLADLQQIDLPIARPDAVEQALQWLVTTDRGRRFVMSSVFRSGRHAAEIARALHDRKLPRALIAVPFVESGYAATAASKAGAVGLWQLMPATARDYGLAVTKTYDQRRGAERSTEAAVEHLSRLYAATGSWELSLAAYDLGLGRLRRTIDRYGVDDYWTLRGIEGALPDETRKYVPMVLACALLLENLEAFGLGGIVRDRAIATSDLEVPVGTHLGVVARAAGTSLRSLLSLNPEILHGKRVPDAASVLHVPAEGVVRAQIMLPTLLDAHDPWTTAVPPDFDWGSDLDPRKFLRPTKPVPHVGLLATVAGGEAPAAKPKAHRPKKSIGKKGAGVQTFAPLVILLGAKSPAPVTKAATKAVTKAAAKPAATPKAKPHAPRHAARKRPS